MLVLRCTAKMLKRLGETPSRVKVQPESSVGEWHVNTVDWLKNGRYAICVNARARYALLVLLDIVDTAEQLGEALMRTLFLHLIQMRQLIFLQELKMFL